MKIIKICHQYSLTLLGIVLALICAVEELSIEQLDANHSKNELKEDVDNQNIENILQRNDDTVKDCFQLGNSVDCFQWSQYSQQFDRLEFLAGRSSTKMVKIKLLEVQTEKGNTMSWLHLPEWFSKSKSNKV